MPLRLAHDLRFAMRSLRRAPVFTLTALLTLGCGIGIASAMFGVVRQVLLAPPPYVQPQRLVSLSFSFPGDPASTRQVGAAADYIQRNSRSFVATGVADGGAAGINVADPAAAGGMGHAYALRQLRISHSFLQTLGVVPALGRGFTAEEDTHGGPRAAMLSDEAWRTRFNADPKVVGRLIRIDEEDVPVVGVLPRGAAADLQGDTRDWQAAGAFQPLQLSPKDAGYEGTNYWMIARLRDGVSTAQAQAELDTLLPQFAHENTWYTEWKGPGGTLGRMRAVPLQAAIAGDSRKSLLLLLGAAGVVLIVACLNLAGLIVARTAARTRELSVRSALGADRRALLTLLLAESSLLAVGGTVLGIVLARLLAQAFLSFAPIDLPHLQPGTGVLATALIAAAFAAVGTLVFGLLPAVIVLGRQVNDGLRSAGSQGQSASYQRTGRVLVVAQVSLTFALLMAASLLMQTFLAMRAVSPGLNADAVTIGQVTLKGDAYGKSARYNRMVSGVVDQLAHTPGVQSTGAVVGLPLDGGLNNTAWPRGHREKRKGVESRFVSAGYMQAMGIPILLGRGIQETDTATSPRVAVISQTMAAKMWPDGDAIGSYLNIDSEWDAQIVGIARDTKEGSLLEKSRRLLYVPMAQTDDRFTHMINNWFPTTFVVRAPEGVNAASIIASAVRNADAELPITRTTTMQSVVDASMAAPRFFGTIATGVAALTLLLASIGLFGLLSYQVTQRTREVGIRMAMGATRGNVLGSIVRRGLLLTALGLAVGAAISAGLPRVLSAALEEFSAVHASSHGAVVTAQAAVAATLLLLLAASAASLIPARRASSVEPIEALRTE